MPASNQSMLRREQGGSPTSQGMNERVQRGTRNSGPNTAYNSGGGNMFGYNPMGSNPTGGQYGNQQRNLGRYQPPGLGGQHQGGYAYNLPNAYGSTGLGYMSGFQGLPFNPFMGQQDPGMNFGGGFGGGQGNNDFMSFLQQMFGQMQGQQQGGQQPGFTKPQPMEDPNSRMSPQGGFRDNRVPSFGRDNTMRPGIIDNRVPNDGGLRGAMDSRMPHRAPQPVGGVQPGPSVPSRPYTPWGGIGG